MNLHGRPTAAELIAAVADFLESDVRQATQGQVNFHARVAANALRRPAHSGPTACAATTAATTNTTVTSGARQPNRMP